MPDLALTSERTTLRLVQSSDLDAIHMLHSFPKTDKFNTLGIPKNRKETETILQTWISEHRADPQQSLIFVIEDKTEEQFIGLFGLKPWGQKFRSAEVWYKIMPTHWNKGLATEVLNAVIEYGFTNLNLHRIQAGVAVNNVGSIRVLEKVGMTREGRGREILPLSTGWSDNFTYAILATDEQKMSK